MPDLLTPEQRRHAMSRVRHYDTDLEKAVRSALHRRGYRFRKHVAGLPGKPDVVFTKAKVVVFVDGDFWHGYDLDKWREKLKPFWRDKIEGNVARDAKNAAALEAAGWTVVRLWGHEVEKDLSSCLDRVEKALKPDLVTGDRR